MPYKSKAQAAYFNIHRKELERKGVDVDEWNDSSRGKKLPKKASTTDLTAAFIGGFLKQAQVYIRYKEAGVTDLVGTGARLMKEAPAVGGSGGMIASTGYSQAPGQAIATTAGGVGGVVDVGAVGAEAAGLLGAAGASTARKFVAPLAVPALGYEGFNYFKNPIKTNHEVANELSQKGVLGRVGYGLMNPGKTILAGAGALGERLAKVDWNADVGGAQVASKTSKPVQPTAQSNLNTATASSKPVTSPAKT